MSTLPTIPTTGAVSTPPVEDHFDRAKPFFPLVVVYLLGLRGVTEMAANGAILWHGQITGTPVPPMLTGDAVIDAGLAKLRGPLNLRAECVERTIDVSLDLLALEIVQNHQAVLPWLLPSLSSVLMLAHEIVTAQLTDAERLEELPQFLRHARNAVGHNGRFKFDPGQPKRPAIWRRFKLDASMHDSPLFRDATGIGLLGPGDPIRLLWDIEQAYPSLKT